MNEAGEKVYETEYGVEYRPHSMMHRAVLQMEPTNLELIEGFEQTKSGHQFTPEDSNVRVVISGRDWSDKRVLIYGSMSSEEAKGYVDDIINRVTDIGHDAKLIEGPEITNIAVSGDFGTSVQLEAIAEEIQRETIDIEYEPEQFPAAITKIDEPSVTFLIFSTGSFVIQGLRGFEDIEPAINRIKSLLDLGTLKDKTGQEHE